jgi:sec-independent protein translocase protein TatA
MAGLGTTEIIIIALVIVLLFGARKLPEAARGIGKSLRIFKAETKGLRDDDEPRDVPPPPPAALPTSQAQPGTPAASPVEHDAKRDSA